MIKSLCYLLIFILLPVFSVSAGKIEKGFACLKIYNYFEAKQLFEKMGKNESELLQNARTPDFQGFSTGMRLSTSLAVEPTYNISKNVIAKSFFTITIVLAILSH